MLLKCGCRTSRASWIPLKMSITNPWTTTCSTIIAWTCSISTTVLLRWSITRLVCPISMSDSKMEYPSLNGKIIKAANRRMRGVSMCLGRSTTREKKRVDRQVTCVANLTSLRRKKVAMKVPKICSKSRKRWPNSASKSSNFSSKNRQLPKFWLKDLSSHWRVCIRRRVEIRSMREFQWAIQMQEPTIATTKISTIRRNLRRTMLN